MLGRVPELIDSVYASASSNNISPVTNFPFISFGFTFLKIFSRSSLTYWINSGLISLSCIDCNYCKCFSVSTGLTIVKQSRSPNTYFINLLIRFFYSIESEEPFCIINAFSRYCFGEIAFSNESVSLRAKSLTTHMNEGNNFWTSSGSQSSRTSDFIWSSFDRLMISDKLFSAFSSIVPMLLYRKNELSRRANKKILVSWFSSSSNAPIPSLSMISTLRGWPW